MKKAFLTIVLLALSQALASSASAQSGGPIGVRGFGIETVQPVRTEVVLSGALKSVTLRQSAKFLCGRIPRATHEETSAQVFPLGPATYQTAINVYNPNDFPVQIVKRAVTSPLNGQPGVVGNAITETLGPKQAIELDAAAIAILAGLPPFTSTTHFFSGFIEISTSVTGSVVIGKPFPEPASIQVVAVYTVSNIPGPGDEGGCEGGHSTQP
jgi:hypothetical protein